MLGLEASLTMTQVPVRPSMVILAGVAMMVKIGFNEADRELLDN